MGETTCGESRRVVGGFGYVRGAIPGATQRVADGEWAAEDSPLRHAPHTADVVGADDWDRVYPRSLAGWPSGTTGGKYWPPVGRIDGGFGDRNLVCSCPSVEDLAEG